MIATKSTLIGWNSIAMVASSLLMLLVQAEAFGLASDNEQPIYIEADSVEIDDRNATSIYKGNVQVRQGSIHLVADQVTILEQRSVNEKIIAIGKPVKFRQSQDSGKPDIRAEALKAEYMTNSEELVLIGNAVLFQGKDSFRSDRITYDRKQAIVKGGHGALGKQRVRVTIENDSNPKQ